MGNWSIETYLNFTINLINFMDNSSNLKAPNYLNGGNLGNISFNSLVYIYSQVLCSFAHTGVLPSNIFVYPWEFVGDKYIFVSMDDVYSLAHGFRESVLVNHTYPSALEFTRGEFRPDSEFLYLAIRAIENKNNYNLYQSIFFNCVVESTTSYEPSLVRGRLSKDEYTSIILSIRNYLLSNLTLPSYVNSSCGYLGSDNYIFMVCEVLDYLSMYNVLPDYVLINPWEVVSSNDSVVLDESKVFNVSNYVVSCVEDNHSLPSSVNIGDKSINQVGMLKGILTTLGLINGSYVGELFLDDFNSTFVSDSLVRGSLNQSEYLTLASMIESSLFTNGVVNGSCSLGNVGLENALYIFSQVLVSYESMGVFPDFVNVKPWSVISSESTHFVSLEDVLNASCGIKAYVEDNNSLPASVVIGGFEVDIGSFTYVLASAIEMIDGKLYANIALENFPVSSNSSETLNKSYVDSDAYLEMATVFVNTVNTGDKIPDYIGTDFGNVRYESLVLLFSTILEYYNTSGSFVNNVVVLPWSVINSSKFFSLEDIVNASGVFKDYVEDNHCLPGSVVVAGVELSVVDFAQVLGEAILDLGDDWCLSIVSLGCNSSYFHNGNLSFVFDIYLSEYMDLVSIFNSCLDENEVVSNVSFDYNGTEYAIGFNSLVYLMSEVLVSYGHCDGLPEFLTFVPWAVVSNNGGVFLTHEDIINGSYFLVDYVNVYHELPDSVVIGNVSVNMVQALDLFTSCIYNINFGLYQSVLLRGFDGSYSSFENIICGDLEFYEYISLVYDLMDCLDNGGVVSNLSDLSLGDNIGFNSLLLMEASVLGNYSFDGKINSSNSSISSFSKVYSEFGLPDWVTIIPWVVISNPGKVYNYRTCEVFDSLQDAICDGDTLDCDYVGIGKSFICEDVVVNKTIYLSSVSGCNLSFVNCSLWLVYCNSTVEGFAFDGVLLVLMGLLVRLCIVLLMV